MTSSRNAPYRSNTPHGVGGQNNERIEINRHYLIDFKEKYETRKTWKRTQTQKIGTTVKNL